MPALRTYQPCNVVYTTHGNKRLDSAEGGPGLSLKSLLVAFVVVALEQVSHRVKVQCSLSTS